MIQLLSGADIPGSVGSATVDYGEIYANIWKTDRIARIDPQSGQVVGWIDLSGLISPQERPDPEAVLNEIAYDDQGRRLFVTGKLWPRLFEIALVKPGAP